MVDKCGTEGRELESVSDAANCGVDAPWQETSGRCDEAVTS